MTKKFVNCSPVSYLPEIYWKTVFTEDLNFQFSEVVGQIKLIIAIPEQWLSVTQHHGKTPSI